MRECMHMTTQPAERGWTPDDSRFGTRLAMIRQAMGWGNTREAAIACGLPVESWRGWERDNRLPRDYATVCRKIAAQTGVDIVWLMGASERAQTRELGPNRPLTRAKRKAESKCIPPRIDGSSPLAQPWTPAPGADPLRRTA